MSSPADLAVNLNGAVMSPGNVFDNCQSQSGFPIFSASGSVAAIKTLKDALLMLRGYAYTRLEYGMRMDHVVKIMNPLSRVQTVTTVAFQSSFQAYVNSYNSTQRYTSDKFMDVTCHGIRLSVFSKKPVCRF